MSISIIKRSVKSLTDPRELYLDLMKRCLLNLIYLDETNMLNDNGYVLDEATGKYVFVKGVPFTMEQKLTGQMWPSKAHTMIGIHRLDNLQECVKHVIENHVPGDLVETGVWRGGATILMRAILQAYGDTTRKVWAADSFEGLPETDLERYPVDQKHGVLNKVNILAVSLEEVQSNFARYGLLDDQVRFLKGWFKDTLPHAPIDRIAVLRLDGDYYESTMDALKALYHKVSKGGFVIVDDYKLEGCHTAINDFRKANNIFEPMQAIDSDAVFWQKAG